MQKLSHELKFEEAAIVRDQIKKLEKIFSQQRVVSQKIEDMDVLTFYQEDSKISVNVLFVRDGLLIGSRDWIIKKSIYENRDELLNSVIEALYLKESLIPPSEIILENLPQNHEHLELWLKEKKRK